MDGGKTWPHSTNINGDKRAEYSALAHYNNGDLVVAWGYNDVFGHTVGEHILVTTIKTGWCEGA